MHRYIYYIIGAREKGTKGGSFPGVTGQQMQQAGTGAEDRRIFLFIPGIIKSGNALFFFAQMPGRVALFVSAAACVQTRRGAALYFRRQRRKYTAAFLSVRRLSCGGRCGGLFVSGSGLSSVCSASPRRCCFPSGSLRGCCPVTLSHRGQAGADHCRSSQIIADCCMLLQTMARLLPGSLRTQIIYTLIDV